MREDVRRLAEQLLGQRLITKETAMEMYARDLVLAQLSSKYGVPKKELEQFDDPWKAEEFCKRYSYDFIEVEGRVRDVGPDASCPEMEDPSGHGADSLPEPVVPALGAGEEGTGLSNQGRGTEPTER